MLARKEAADQAHLNRMEELKARGADAAALQAERLRHDEQMKRFMVAMRPPRAETPLEAIIGPDGKAILVPRSAAVGQTPAPKGGGEGKPLPPKLQSDLIEKGQILDSSERFTKTFKPEYGGFVSDTLGNLTLTAERKLSGDTPRAQWWQDYELHQSVVRNKLFGSALTAPEIAAWEKSAIAPGMNADQIKANLARRETIERAGLTRMARSSAVSYNKTAIEESLGRPIPAAESAPAVSSDGWTVKEKK
jgi:hypothetical protein